MFHILSQHAGWVPASKMIQKYTHYYNNESSKAILEASGIITNANNSTDTLRPKQCPQCNEPNKPDGKFCAKCRTVLTYDAYSESLEQQKEKESEVQRLQEKYQQDMKVMREEMNQQLNQIISMIQENPKLSQIKPEALTGKKVR